MCSWSSTIEDTVKAKLRCLTGEPVERTFEGEARIGRSGRNDIVIAADVVSGHHARVWHDRDADTWFVEDLGSTNGTEVANRPVARPEPLLDLDIITLGGAIEVLFQRIGAARPPTRPTDTRGETPPADRPAPLPETARESPPAPLMSPATQPETRIAPPWAAPPGSPSPPEGPRTIAASPWRPTPGDPGAPPPPDTIVERPLSPPPAPPRPGPGKNEP
jgi:hypothetical protein